MNRYDEDNMPSPSPELNYMNIASNIYSIGRASDNSLEVKSPKNRNSPESAAEYPTDMTRSINKHSV
jgi:hypothetical protein